MNTKNTKKQPTLKLRGAQPPKSESNPKPSGNLHKHHSAGKGKEASSKVETSVIDTEKLGQLMESSSLTDNDNMEMKEATSSTPNSHKKKEPLPKMGGAMKKRFNRLRKQGLSIEEALEKAKTPLGPAQQPKKERPLKPEGSKHSDEAARPRPVQPKGGKRRRAGDSTISTKEEVKRPKMGKHQSTQKDSLKKPPYSEIAGSVKVGMAPMDFPLTKVTSNDLDIVMMEVKKLICEESGNCTPIFTQRPFIKDGFIIFICKDVDTAQWLASRNIWEKKQWKTMNEENFPDRLAIVGYFPGAAKDSNETIMKLIQSQNTGITTSKWGVASRRNLKTLARVTFFVDEDSMKVLQVKNFILDFGFGAKVKMYRRTKSNDEVEKDDEMQTSDADPEGKDASDDESPNDPS
jgi:hypothetical protein